MPPKRSRSAAKRPISAVTRSAANTSKVPTRPSSARNRSSSPKGGGNRKGSKKRGSKKKLKNLKPKFSLYSWSRTGSPKEKPNVPAFGFKNDYYLPDEYNELRGKMKELSEKIAERKLAESSVGRKTPRSRKDSAAAAASNGASAKRLSAEKEAAKALMDDFDLEDVGEWTKTINNIEGIGAGEGEDGTAEDNLDLLDYFEERHCSNYADPREPKCVMSLPKIEDLVDLDGLLSVRTSPNSSPQPPANRRKSGSKSPPPSTERPSINTGLTGQQSVSSIELRKPSNIRIIEDIVVNYSETGRQLKRAFYTAFGDDYGDRLTLLQFKTFVRDTGVCERGVSLSSMSIMFTTLTKPHSTMCLGGFVLSMFFLASMIKTHSAMEDMAALEHFAGTVLDTYVATYLPAWADPETDYSVSNAVVKRLINAYELPLRDLFALSECNPMNLKKSRPHSTSIGGSKNTFGGGTGHSSPVATPQSTAAGRRQSLIGSSATANAQEPPPAKSSKTIELLSPQELARYQNFFPSFVAPDSEEYFKIGCEHRTFIKLHMLIRFLNSLELFHITTTDILRAVRAASFMYPKHPLRQPHSPAMVDCDGLFLLFPEFVDALVRIAVVAYPLPGTTTICPSPLGTPRQSVVGSLIPKPPPKGGSLVNSRSGSFADAEGTEAGKPPLLPTAKSTTSAAAAAHHHRKPSVSVNPAASTKRTTTVGLAKHPGESFDLLLQNHLRDAYFTSFREPIKLRMDPDIVVEEDLFGEGGLDQLDHEDPEIAKLPLPQVYHIALRHEEDRSLFAMDTTIVRNDVHVGQVACVKEDGGVLKLAGIKADRPVYVLFNNRVGVRCYTVDSKSSLACCLAPPLGLIIHKLSKGARDTDFHAFRNAPQTEGEENEEEEEEAPFTKREDIDDQRESVEANHKPQRCVYCVKDGASCIRVLSVLRFPISLRFSCDAIHWTPRTELPSLASCHLQSRNVEEALKKYLPTKTIPEPQSGVVLYEQRLPAATFPAEMARILLVVFHNYCNYKDPFNDGFLNYDKFRHFCSEYFTIRSSRKSVLAVPEDAEGVGEEENLASPEVEEPQEEPVLRLTSQNMKKSFDAHCVGHSISKSQTIRVLREAGFLSAVLELIVNEHVGVEQLDTANLMRASFWWETLAEVLSRHCTKRLQRLEMSDDQNKQLASPEAKDLAIADGKDIAPCSPKKVVSFFISKKTTVSLADALSPLKIQPKRDLEVPPQDLWPLCFSVEHSKQDLSVLGNGKDGGGGGNTGQSGAGGGGAAANFAIPRAAFTFKATHQIFDVFHGPLPIGTISDTPGTVKLSLAENPDSVIEKRDAALSFAMHAPVGGYTVPRYLLHAVGFLPTLRRLVSEGHNIFSCNLGKTINGVPQFQQPLNHFTRHTLLAKKIHSEPSSANRLNNPGRLDGLVATRLWKITNKNHEFVGAMINIPGKLCTLDSIPQSDLFSSPVASLTMYKCDVLSAEFYKISEVFRSAKMLPELRESIQGLGYGLVLAFPL